MSDPLAARPSRTELWQPLAIAGLSLLLLANCWGAPFINYDDVAHIQNIPEIFGKAPLSHVFLTREGGYLPLTFLTYRFDYVLFHDGLGMENWAPGVRFMTWFYHALAALALWRLIRQTGVERMTAFFIALVFAVHPTCCETVCWASERKNALAAMFGFAALLAYVKFDGRIWRTPLAVLLYFAANLSKPSALGLLPIFVLIDLFGGALGLRGVGALRWRPNRTWLDTLERIVPFVAVSLWILRMNLSGEAATIVEPPGGSVFTALLTDVEIFVRYLKALLLPFGLSAAYYVEPIVALTDPRLAVYGLALAAAVALTVGLAANRRRALFGWLWFFAALGPVANLIPNSYPMTDRYIYLSIPGFFLALCEMIDGLRARFEFLRGSTLRIAAAVFIAVLIILSVDRSALFADSIDLLADAARKQPLSAYAHYGLSSSYAGAWQKLKDNPASDPKALEDARRRAIKERAIFLECPDAYRQVYYPNFALEAGEEAIEAKDFAAAEHYLTLCAFPIRGARTSAALRASALRDFALLRISQGGREKEAYEMADKSVQSASGNGLDASRFVRARAALAWAKALGSDEQAHILKTQAREDLETIPRGSEFFERAAAVKQKNFSP